MAGCDPFPRDIMRWSGEALYRPLFNALLNGNSEVFVEGTLPYTHSNLELRNQVGLS